MHFIIFLIPVLILVLIRISILVVIPTAILIPKSKKLLEIVAFLIVKRDIINILSLHIVVNFFKINYLSQIEINL